MYFLDTVSEFTSPHPSSFVLLHLYNLSFFFKRVYKFLGLTASSGLHFSLEDSHMLIKIVNKMYIFSLINLSYGSLILRSAREPRKVEGRFFSLRTPFSYLNPSVIPLLSTKTQDTFTLSIIFFTILTDKDGLITEKSMWCTKRQKTFFKNVVIKEISKFFILP